MVTRETEWDDLERDRMLALTIYERGICRCGFHESLTSDPENHFTFDTVTCPVCRASDQFGRVQHAQDQRAAEQRGPKAPPGQPRPEDGRRTMLRRMSATEVEERRASRGAGPTADRRSSHYSKEV